MTVILALNTSTEACIVAVQNNSDIVSRNQLSLGSNTSFIFPMIKDVLEEIKVHPSDIEFIAFGQGPGYFTGLRVALSIAQGLALGLECPVIPISDLAILAQQAFRKHNALKVAVATDARMGQIYWGCYEAIEGEMQLIRNEEVVDPEKIILPQNPGKEWFGVGNGWKYSERIKLRPAVVKGEIRADAQDLLSLANFSLKRGLFFSADEVKPVYLRTNVAMPMKRYT